MDRWAAWWRRDGDAVYVDVEDYKRQRVIREAEYQAAVDAGSKVLRVRGKVPEPVRRVTGLTEIVRVALR